jgi:hypothetical protein
MWFEDKFGVLYKDLKRETKLQVSYFMLFIVRRFVLITFCLSEVGRQLPSITLMVLMQFYFFLSMIFSHI